VVQNEAGGHRAMMRLPIIGVSYVRLGTRHVEESARFASDVLGLQRVKTDNGEATFRSDSFYHRVCLTKGAVEEQSVGLELPDESYFEPAKAALTAAGFSVREGNVDECKRRFVRACLFTQDGSGNCIELVTRPEQSGRRYFPSRDAGITGFHGVSLRSTALKRDIEFWTDVFDVQVSDRVGEIVYLRIDSKHHRIALYPSKRKGILDVALNVESLDSIMQANYFLRERQIKVVHGPGRETASDQLFIRFEGPEGYIFSYVHGMRDVEPKERARQFLPEAKSLCSWGSECTDLPELTFPSSI
jgi:2,3-dihydroxy-p-cumate/2,3-dihydroxybenzoate 3,4-dioxygenase